MKRRAPRWTRLVTTTLLAGVVAAGCGSADNAASPSLPTTPGVAESTKPRVVSAEQGAAARARYVPLQRSTELTAQSSVLGPATADCGVEYVPSAEEISAANGDTAGLIAAFDRFGIEYTSTTDDWGYLVVDYAYHDAVAQSVAASYWADRYPIEPVAQEELDAIIANNDVVAAQLDAAGLAYERRTDDLGYESIDYDYDDPAAQAAVEAAWMIISPPQPPTGPELEQQTELNNALMTAFDAAGVPYELVTDALGWAWVEWDTTDATIAQRYDDIINELYPPITIDPIVECEVLEGPIELPQPDPNTAPTEPAEPIGTDAVNAQPEILPVEPELPAQDAAQRASRHHRDGQRVQRSRSRVRRPRRVTLAARDLRHHRRRISARDRLDHCRSAVTARRLRRSKCCHVRRSAFVFVHGSVIAVTDG